MKICQFCAEKIQDKAIKCRWCGEFLTEDKKETSKASVQKTKVSENANISSHMLCDELPKRETRGSKIETVQVIIDGKIVEVPRWYKDLNENQKSGVKDKVFLWKLLGIFFPGISLLRARCYLRIVPVLIVSLVIKVSIDYDPQFPLAEETITGLFTLILSIVLSIIIFFKLATIAYNRSKGNLRRVAYLAILKSKQKSQNIKSENYKEVEININSATVDIGTIKRSWNQSMTDITSGKVIILTVTTIDKLGNNFMGILPEAFRVTISNAQVGSFFPEQFTIINTDKKHLFFQTIKPGSATITFRYGEKKIGQEDILIRHGV